MMQLYFSTNKMSTVDRVKFAAKFGTIKNKSLSKYTAEVRANTAEVRDNIWNVIRVCVSPVMLKAVEEAK